MEPVADDVFFAGASFLVSALGDVDVSLDLTTLDRVVAAGTAFQLHVFQDSQWQLCQSSTSGTTNVQFTVSCGTGQYALFSEQSLNGAEAAILSSGAAIMVSGASNTSTSDADVNNGVHALVNQLTGVMSAALEVGQTEAIETDRISVRASVAPADSLNGTSQSNGNVTVSLPDLGSVLPTDGSAVSSSMAVYTENIFSFDASADTIGANVVDFTLRSVAENGEGTATCFGSLILILTSR